MSPRFDRLFKNVRIVRPEGTSTPNVDIGVRDERFVEIAESLE